METISEAFSATSTASASHSAAHRLQSVPTRALHVLIVAKDALLRARLEAIVECAGHAAFSADSVAEARVALTNWPFEIVIIDEVLDGEDAKDLPRSEQILNRFTVASQVDSILGNSIRLLSKRDPAEQLLRALAAAS